MKEYDVGYICTCIFSYLKVYFHGYAIEKEPYRILQRHFCKKKLPIVFLRFLVFFTVDILMTYSLFQYISASGFVRGRKWIRIECSSSHWWTYRYVLMIVVWLSIAAALSYGLGVAGTKNIVICDFGGGTFDVSVMNITEGQFKVFQSAIKEMNRYWVLEAITTWEVTISICYYIIIY